MKPAELMGKVMALSNEEYVEFKALVRNYDAMRAPALMAAFKPGDYVRFNGGAMRGEIVAKVEKYGIKNIKAREITRNGLKSLSQARWTVRPSSLVKLSEAEKARVLSLSKGA